MLFFGLMFFVSVISSLLLSEIILRVSEWGHVQDLRTASQGVIDHVPGMFEPGQDFTTS
jgi:hypothetical protein